MRLELARIDHHLAIPAVFANSVKILLKTLIRLQAQPGTCALLLAEKPKPGCFHLLPLPPGPDPPAHYHPEVKGQHCHTERTLATRCA